ncbi:MAG TPA: type 1 glutamine amidotransferase [Proteobacteria bacterium]|nr:GMP synthase [glutamine-hydrolyzing] [bacterium BMS3Abin14]HDL53308.1 type 1 glutamine amidotransferase [Pseudomonadota bacterium]
MVVIFQHVPFEGPGLIAEMLDGRGIPYMVLEPYKGDPTPLSPAGFTGVISMGGPMSSNDDLDFLAKEKAFLAEAAARRMPVLGVCLGAQLLAAALGAGVNPGQEKEVGWGNVALTDEGKTDPLFSGAGDNIPVLHWHGETFDLPHGAVLLASSHACVNQAFRWHGSVYGFQFHLEADGEMVKEWIEEDLAGCCPMVEDPAGIIKDTGEFMDNAHLTASLILGRFLDMLARA